MGSAKVTEGDPNMLAADCIVICSCCPCLVIQILAVIFIRLPQKLARRAKRAVVLLKRSRCGGCRGEKKPKNRMMRVHSCRLVREDSLQRPRDGDDGTDSDFTCPIQAAGDVFKELYDAGVLGFGDFGRSRAGGGGEQFQDSAMPDCGTCVWVTYS